jgi:hypothetical protein
MEKLFMRVDADCNGTVDWDEFCSYMLLENQVGGVTFCWDHFQGVHPLQ